MPTPIVVHHHIQREILQRLASGSERFSQLKPDGLESNIFMYHLKQLQSQRLVHKVDSYYRLTTEGLRYLDGLSTESFVPRLQPKVIAILSVRDMDGKIALLQRRIEPAAGKWMLPSGKLHFGESPTEHAKRELYEKTGLRAELRYSHTISLTMRQNGEPFSHAIGLVWQATVPADLQLVCTDKRFGASWLTLPAAPDHLAPGTLEIISCKSNGYLEIDVA